MSKEISNKIKRIVKLETGEEVILRLAKEIDMPKVWNSYKHQPNEFYNFLPLFNEEMVKSWYLEINHSVAIPINAFLWENEAESEFLGNCTFLPLPHEEMTHTMGWGINIITEYQGKGLGKALLSATIDIAQECFNLKRIELEVMTGNKRAITLYEKYGFEIEGRLKKRWIRGGKFQDMYIMAKLLD